MNSAIRPPSAVIDYRFRQRFRMPARAAFAWATDFTGSDWAIAGISGERGVERVSPTMVRLTDRIEDPAVSSVTKVRIVQLYPETLSWVSTHVGGPCLHSQFRYSIAPVGRRTSVLTFQGREIRWETRPSGPGELRTLRSQLRAGDVTLWKCFAREMERQRASEK